MLKSDKIISNERRVGSMDSIDTFSSCFTHPFNSLVDLDEEQFNQSSDLKKSNELKLEDKRNLIRNHNKISDINNLPENQLKSIQTKNEERTKKSEVPLIVDLVKNQQISNLEIR